MPEEQFKNLPEGFVNIDNPVLGVLATLAKVRQEALAAFFLLQNPRLTVEELPVKYARFKAILQEIQGIERAETAAMLPPQ